MYYLFYLIPGIIVYKTYHIFKPNIPKERDGFRITLDIVIMTVVNFSFSFIFLLIRAGMKNSNAIIELLENKNVVNYLFAEEIWFIIIILIIIPMILTLLSYLLLDRLYISIFKVETGSTTFRTFLEAAITRVNEDEGKESAVTSFVLKVTHRNNLVGTGRIVKIYNLPWDFKDLIITYEELNINANPIYIYYDVESEIKYELYAESDLKENSNE